MTIEEHMAQQEKLVVEVEKLKKELERMTENIKEILRIVYNQAHSHPGWMQGGG